MPHNKYPSLMVLSTDSNGAVQCTDDDDKPLVLLEHEKPLACIFVPILIVEQQLAYKNYVLYVFANNDDLSNKIKKIKQHEQHAILLIGTDSQREIYYIEDHTLVSDAPVSLFCEAHLELIEELEIGLDGKVASREFYYLDAVVKLLRNAGNRGYEAEISGTRVGLNVFSRDFSPCNAIVAKRKVDNQFVLHHSTSASMDKTRPGVSLFLQGVGEGFSFVAVMQNPRNKKNHLKAPILAAQLAIELDDEGIDRINIPEGYGAIACINGDTIIIAQRLEFFKDESDKRQFIEQLKTKSEDVVRFIELEKECLSLPETAKVLRGQLREEDNLGMREVYSNLLGQLGLFSAVQENLPPSEKKSKCTIM
ncbi:hypothetical protein ACD661_14135 [Legionella lytica]|uniref:Uncharacterized protein n=1 Tax=Legionella lytica TaxID=96232 RepID=A0ABW8DDR9_9GAMM